MAKDPFKDLPCPFCGTEKGRISVNVRDGIGMHCTVCGRDFDAGAARTHIEKTAAAWAKVLDWCQRHPSNPHANG